MSAVVRPVHTIPVSNIQPYACLAHARVHDARIRVRHRYRANRSSLEIPIGHILPVCATVISLPDSARARAKIECAGVSRVASNRDHATAARRTDAAPLQRVQHLRVYVVRSILKCHIVSPLLDS